MYTKNTMMNMVKNAKKTIVHIYRQFLVRFCKFNNDIQLQESSKDLANDMLKEGEDGSLIVEGKRTNEQMEPFSPLHLSK